MAKVNGNIVTKGLQGSLGDVVFKKLGNTQYVSLKPGPRTKPPTEKQLARMARFKIAVKQAKEILADQAKRAYWDEQAAAQGRLTYHVLVSHFMGQAGG